MNHSIRKFALIPIYYLSLQILAVYYPHRVEGDGAVMKSIGTTSMKYNGTSDGNSAGITHTRITNLKGFFANANSDI